MPTGRSALALTSAPDGRLYAIGGWDGFSQSYATVEIYSPTTNAWTTGAPMPTARNSMGAATGKDGRIYVVGGGTVDNAPTIATLEIYDPVRDAWSTGPDMPTARQGLAAVLGGDGRIYAIGGDNAGYGGQTLYYSNVEAYDPLGGSWSTAAALPFAAAGIGAARGPDGLLYVVASKSTAAYDVTKQTGSMMAPMPDDMFEAAVTTGPDGLLYVIGGEQGLNVWPQVQAYDTVKQSWTSLLPGLSTARDLLGAAVAGDGRIYAVGGYLGNGVTAAAEAYDPAGSIGWTP
jgi:N-acetylneuraminic acid mutarotase